MTDKKFRNKKKVNKKKVTEKVISEVKDLVSKKNGEFFEAIGRRKTATTRVRLYPEKKTTFSINGKNLEDFFKNEELQKKVKEALEEQKENFLVSAYVKGSGISAQAEAIRLGISRALLKSNPENRAVLKEKGFLKRDPRSVERKKPGLKKARKAPTWVKR